MIEKIERVDADFVDKINQLIDAVNELQKHEEQHLDLLTQLNEMRLHQNKEPADQAEQKKWIGKVCQFWNGGNGKKFKNIGVLIEILSADNKRRYTCASKPKKHFEFCEPVKPDDDIIYKGE